MSRMRTADQHWLRTDDWKLKVCLETFGCALDLPFQALNMYASEALEDSISSGNLNGSIDSIETLLKTLNEVPKDVEGFTDWYLSNTAFAETVLPELEDCLCLTDCCYSGPLSRAFRDCSFWQFWECCLLLEIVMASVHPGDELPDLKSCNCFGVDAHMGCFRSTELGALIICWPIRIGFSEAKLGDPSITGAKIVSTFENTMRLLGQELTVSSDTLVRLANMRAGATSVDVVSRLKIAANALATISSLEVGEEQVVGRANLERIASASVFTQTMVRFDQTDTPRNEGAPIDALIFKLPGTAPGAYEPVSDRALHVKTNSGSSFLAKTDEKDWNALLGADLAKSTSGQIAATPCPSDGKAAQLEMFERIDATFSWFMDTLTTRRNAHDFETYLLLEQWCIHSFGDIDSLLHGSVGETPEAPGSAQAGSKMAERVATVLGADFASIDFYHRKENCLETLGFHHNSHDVEAEVQSEIESFLKKLGKQKKQRKKSIIYRAIDEAAPQQCHSFQPETGKSNPRGQRLLTMPDHLPPLSSANVAPINVYGRPWGVITIGGSRHYQFASNAATTLLDLSNLLGSHIYHHWLLDRLETMDRAATEGRGVPGQRYRTLCECLCDILLADAAVIWVKNLVSEDVFDAAGWVNRPDLDKLLEQRGIDPSKVLEPEFYSESDTEQEDVRPIVGRDWPISFSIRDSGRVSLSGQTVKENRDWSQGTIGEGPLTGDWQKKPHTKGLPALGFTSLCVVPVRFNGKTRACISLFSRSKPYDKRWEALMRMIGEEVAVMIEAIEMRSMLEVNLFKPLRHEIQPGLRQAHERIASFDRVLDEKEIQEVTQFNRLSHLQSDLSFLHGDLSWRVDNILRQRFRPTHEYFKDIVLQEAEERSKNYDGSGVNLSDMLNEISITLTKQFYKKNLKFSIRRVSKYIHWHIDEITAREIIRNLMINAAKYCPIYDEIIIELRETNTFNLIITNSGPELDLGLGNSRLVFQRGFRSSHARIQDKEGTGLGLYYVDQLCKLYNMSARYNPKKSTDGQQIIHQFEIIIPRKRIGK